MAGTIQQIAQLAGVSRGTVDRALNNRGRINPEVEKKIKEIAKEIGYIPKSKSKKSICIGIVTQLAKSSFMLEVNKGISDAVKKLEQEGIKFILKECISVDEKEQLKALEQLEQNKINGLAIMPVDSELIRQKLNTMSIPIVTFNSDIVGTKRTCFVGMDNYRSGETAAGLMSMLLRGKGDVLIITGFFSNNVNNTRVDGFVKEIKNSFPEINIIGVHSSFDETDEVEKIIINTMERFPHLNGILVVSGGQEGVRNAFNTLKPEKRPAVIIYDLTPKNKKLLNDTIADFLIDQEGYIQGYQPPHILYELILKNQKPKNTSIYTEINIKTKYNL